MNSCKIAACGCGLLLSFSAMAVEFNLNVLDKSMRNSVDLSLLKDDSAIAPGSYFVTVAVNKNQISSGRQLTWKKHGESVAVCIPSDLARQLGLKEKILNSLPVHHDCIDFAEYNDIAFNLDMANQRLDISVPQVLLAWKSESWMPPQAGIMV